MEPNKDKFHCCIYFTFCNIRGLIKGYTIRSKMSKKNTEMSEYEKICLYLDGFLIMEKSCHTENLLFSIKEEERVFV